MRFPLVALLLLMTVVPTLAAATGWQELAPDTRVRMIASERLGPDGTTLIAFELDMPANTKTYWRIPGETGIPTELDFAGSTGVAGHRVIWPYPQVEKTGGYTDFVYLGPTVIPVELTLEGDTATLQVAVLMGICSDICVPAMADFTLSLDFGSPDAGQDIRISQALAEAPIAWSGPAAAVGEPSFDPAKELLWILFDPSAIDAASFIVDASISGHVFGAPQKSPQPGLVSLPLLGGGDGAGLGGHSIQLLFRTRDGPFEVERRVKALAPGAE